MVIEKKAPAVPEHATQAATGRKNVTTATYEPETTKKVVPVVTRKTTDKGSSRKVERTSRPKRVPNTSSRTGRRAENKCPGCEVRVGEHHSRACRTAQCWRCKRDYATCWCAYPETFIYCGDLDSTFSHFNAFHGFELFPHEFEMRPDYDGGRLVGLTTNGYNPGLWRDIDESPQSKHLRHFTLALPHLTLQRPEDCARALSESRWRKQLRFLQFGLMSDEWDHGLNQDHDAVCEGRDAEMLANLLWRMPVLAHLVLAVWFPDMDAILKTLFPPKLKSLCIGTHDGAHLGLIAQNRSLKSIESLIVVKGWKGISAKAFRHQLSELVNAPHLKHLQELGLELPEIDDEACNILASGTILKRLRRLRVCGKSITDIGAQSLAASREIRALDEVCIESPNLTERGIGALRAAGVNLSSHMPDDDE